VIENETALNSKIKIRIQQFNLISLGPIRVFFERTGYEKIRTE